MRTEPKPRPYIARQRAYRRRIKTGEVVLGVTVEREFMERLLTSPPAERPALAQRAVGLLVDQYLKRYA